MFNADGSYSPPDVPTPHALVAMKAHEAKLRTGDPVDLPAGHVFKVMTLGASQYDGAPAHANPVAEAVWIEHATAKPKDVLPMDEVTPAVALAKKKQAAVAAFRAEAAKNPPPSPAELRFQALEKQVAALVAAAKPSG